MLATDLSFTKIALTARKCECFHHTQYVDTNTIISFLLIHHTDLNIAAADLHLNRKWFVSLATSQ
jgi:hypothetical protein